MAHIFDICSLLHENESAAQFYVNYLLKARYFFQEREKHTLAPVGWPLLETVWVITIMVIEAEASKEVGTGNNISLGPFLHPIWQRK